MLLRVVFLAALMSSASAVFRCSRSGIFHTDDPEMYVECSFDEKLNRIIAALSTCGAGEQFSPSESRCIPRTGIKSNFRAKRDVAENLSETSTVTQCGPHNNLTGLVCLNRTHAALCLRTFNQVDIASGTTMQLMNHCPEDEVCVEGKGCTRNSAMLSRNRPFACTSVGHFPDPYNCSVYYNCTADPSNAEKYIQNEMACNSGQIYAPNGTGSCINRTEGYECFTDPFCYSVLQVGVLSRNSNIFYVCTTDPNYPGDVSPAFYRCPLENQVFNPATMSCAPEDFNWGSLPNPTIL